MPLELYNSMTRRKERFEPITPGYVGIYYCGPTVYSEPHLGHARGPVVFDVLRRWFEHVGYRVRLVSNITDVGHLTDDSDDGEDKLLRRAKLEQLEPMEVADKYFWAYENAMSELGIRRPDITPRASGHITEQISMIGTLLERGLAYESQGSVYFDVSAWEPYGELSGREPDELVEGTRIDTRSEKRDPRDFALWKRAERGHLMKWPSPWSEGYPGWHLECSAMSTKYLGSEFDIHGGGLDLIFPHHECELAQSKGAGKAFARYWLHWNMLTLGGEKMSKSKGHVVSLGELFREFDPMVVRFHLLRSHYRSVSDFSEESLTGSMHGLRRLQELHRVLQERSTDISADASGPAPADELEQYRERFTLALNDDLNTPQAVASLFDAAREVNRRLEERAEPSYIAAARALFDDLFGSVLGMAQSPVSSSGNVDSDVLGGVLELLLEQRHEARLRRDFPAADRIRERLAALGVVVEDSAEGSRWKLA